MTDALVETLRLRGPGTARLTRVAATALPDALDRALAGLPDAHIDVLSVRLNLDPADYDDFTLATLWASQIRAELERLLPQVGGASALPDDAAGSAWASSSRVVTAGDAMLAASTWLADSVHARSVPTDALALAEAVVDAPLSARDARVSELLVALDAALRTRRPATPGTFHTPSRGTLAGPIVDAPGVPERDVTVGAAVGASPEPPGTAEREVAVPPNPSVGNADPARANAAAARIAALAALAEPHALAIDLDAVTSGAGLALLYPWLAEVCRAATSLHPGLDEPSVRAHALAALVDPADPALLADPLVLFLAGASEPIGDHVPLPHADELHANAERALSSFASLLPGFATSSPDFIRAEWIRRTGLLDVDIDPARLTAATHPLDVVLGRLPYPMALFKLPWTPALMVRFRP